IITANSSLPGQFTNTATVASSITDVQPNNNAAAAGTTVGTVHERWVAQVYLDMLRRQVDLGGLSAWSGALDAGASYFQVVFAIQSAPGGEYRILQVNDAYQKYLHRPADPTGMATFVPFLQRGGTVEQMAAILIGSPEYFQTRAGGNLTQFENAPYLDVLHRPLDPIGNANLTAMLSAQLASRSTAAQFLLATPEAK